MATTAAATRTNGRRASVDARPRPARGPGRHRQLPLVVVGVLLVLGCALAFTDASLHLGSREQILVVAQPVSAGQVLTAGDFRPARVSTGSGLDVVLVGEESSVIGRRAAVPLVAGSLLTASEVGNAPPVGSGSDVVAVGLKAGAYPPDLAPGDRVQVVPVTSSSDGSSATVTNGSPVGAIVLAIEPASADSDSPTVFSLQVSTANAGEVASLAAAGQASLVELGAGAEVVMVAFGSVRSCGVTTLALSLAATWPAERRVLLVEADPAGGTLAAGSVWAPEPSLVSLAAAARRGGDPSLVWDHCQQLPGEVAVLAGPPSAEHARTALTMLHPLLGRLGELDADVLVDCGRLDLGSPLGPLWERSDRAVLVVRPRLADLQALATWLENLSFNGDHLGLVTVGDGPFADTEIAEALGVAVLARVPWDPAAAEALVSVPASSRQLRLAPLARAARTFADQLARARTRTPPPNDAVTAEPTSGVSLAVRSRVWKAFRPQTKPAASNGRAPKDVSQ